MPTTEAGKRLLDGMLADDQRALLAKSIDAIEAEAVQRAHAGDAEFLDDLTTEVVAAERARIRAAVEGLEHVWCDDLDCSHDDLSYQQQEHPWLDRSAVLAIIDGEEA